MDVLRTRRCWIFDMDGTLTVPVHDFDSMRRELGLPDGIGTLEGLAALAPKEQERMRPLLDAIGWRYVALAKPQPEAAALLRILSARGSRLGLLTRNGRKNTLGTLAKVGIDGFFAPEDVLTRDDGAPKPAPDGVRQLLASWRAEPDEAVMVGDAVYDVQAGRAAGAATVLLDPRGDSPTRDLADYCIRDLGELRSLLS